MKLEKVKKVLFVTPHCDDEIIHAGATIHKLVKGGCQVKVLAFSEEEYDRMKQVAEKVGYECELIQNAVDNFGAAWMAIIIDRLLSFRPDVVITTNTKDFYEDHAKIGRIVQQAVYFADRRAEANKQIYKRPILLFGSPLQYMQSPSWEGASVYCSIGVEDIKSKVETLTIYDWFPEQGPNKVYDLVHDRAWSIRKAEACGDLAGCRMAEVFELANVEPVLEIV